MGVRFPLNRRQIIEQHLVSMQTYAIMLHNSLWPWVSARKVAERIDKCADEIDRAHQAILKREKEASGG